MDREIKALEARYQNSLTLAEKRLGQKALQSFLEACINTFVGFFLSYFLALAIIPVPPSQNIKIVLAFTVLSLLRSYLLRRLFNFWHTR